jgi:hypothetical protein
VAFGETQPPPAPDSELIRAIFSSILRQSASADVACGGSGMNARISGTTVPKKEPIDNAIKFCSTAGCCQRPHGHAREEYENTNDGQHAPMFFCR